MAENSKEKKLRKVTKDEGPSAAQAAADAQAKAKSKAQADGGSKGMAGYDPGDVISAAQETADREERPVISDSPAPAPVQAPPLYDVHEEEPAPERVEDRIEKRRAVRGARRRRNKRVTVFVVIVVFALLGTMCGKDIVRLKAENRALRKQQAALEKQRDELQEELNSVGEKEYLREQARRQLRLLNPGEILFTFDDDESGDSNEKSDL